MAWQVQEAKADLSALIRAAESAGPQSITRNGTPVAVVLSQADYEQLQRVKMARSGWLLAFLHSWPALDIADRDRSDVGRGIEL